MVVGGWLNASVADWFEEYARLCYTVFGDQVKFWITLNEPKETAIQGKVVTHHNNNRLITL